MRKWNFKFGLLLLISCSQTPTNRYPLIYADRHQTVPVSAGQSPSLTMDHQLKFLRHYYEPIKDPLTGKDRIPEDCLQKIKFGEVTPFSGGLYSFSSVYFTPTAQLGCPGPRQAEGAVLILYCERRANVTVYHIRYPAKLEQVSELETLCGK